ncbi:DNA end-binding protein Ku [Granulicella aggregans]|uniref:Non-homologous end joining protein Ku n=1 Tax=Granulicella aggregans TaxID=474949 RepID=A0A7W8E7N5_9BACT|nr:Ku protein [Granulicella aggregans]MBB5060455.1 DNA end-binding protein Ku [Granulicella aggregans]
MARPYWSGQVQISLVSFGVSLYVATESKSNISFHQISRNTGERVRHQKVLESAAETGNQMPGAVVEKNEIVKGYEYSKGRYIIIEPEELDNLRVPSKHTIAVSQFIEQAELNPEFVEKPYFVVPENAAQAEAFAVVRQALLKSGKIAIGKIAFSGREHIFALTPAGTEGRGMLGYTLRYQNELRNQMDYFRDIKEAEISEDSLELAEALIAKKSAKFDLSKFEDGYEVAVKELVDAKINHLPIPADEIPKVRPANLVDLMDALRKSLGSEKPVPKKPSISEKSLPSKGIGLVKTPAKAAARRKSA